MIAAPAPFAEVLAERREALYWHTPCARYFGDMTGHGPAHSRRRYPRLEVLGRIEGQILALDAKLTVRELSRGGFSLNSNRPFAPGLPHTFRFTTADRQSVQLGATSVHCRIGSISTDGRQTYVAGFEWVDEPGAAEAIESLVEALALELSR